MSEGVRDGGREEGRERKSESSTHSQTRMCIRKPESACMHTQTTTTRPVKHTPSVFGDQTKHLHNRLLVDLGFGQPDLEIPVCRAVE